MRSLIALLSILAITLPVYAQQDPQPDQDDRDSARGDSEQPDIPRSSKQLDRVKVVGRAQRLYRVDNSSFATRTESDLQKVPQSIQILPEELINDQAARQITDLYRSISGVSVFSYSGVTFRGFRQDEILYDGVRGDPFNGFAVPQLFNISRVEVLKGPSGALYGSGQPGGIINYVTKKPARQPLRRVEIGVGNDDFYSGSLELSGPAGRDDQWQYRIGAYADHEDTFRFVTNLENRIADVGLRRDFGNASSVLLQLTRVDQEFNGARLRGVPVDDNGEFLTTRRWNHNEPTDFQNLEADVAQLRVDHEFSATLRADATLRYYDNTELQNYHEPAALLDTNGDGVPDFSARQFRDQRRENDSLSLTTNFIADFNFGGFSHTLLFGGDIAEQESLFLGRALAPQEIGGIVPGLSLIDPVYGLTSAADYNLEQFPVGEFGGESTRYGFYLQDQLEITPRWNILAGLRWDSFEDYDRTNDARFDDSDLNYRLGSTFELTDGVRIYGMWGTGFVPQGLGSQNPLAGGPFDPEESRLLEAGLKSRLFDDRIAVNAAVYRIVRENILQPDPTGDPGDDGVDDLITVGEVTSDGFELDLLGDLTPNWVLNFSYAYNDARVTEATGSIRNSVGERFVNAPEHQIGLWTRYDFRSINSAIAGGAQFVDDRISFNDQRVPNYTIFDISWQTRFDQWLLQVNVKNLFDRVYAESGFLERTGHFPGEPRRIFASLTYDF